MRMGGGFGASRPGWCVFKAKRLCWRERCLRTGAVTALTLRLVSAQST